MDDTAPRAPGRGPTQEPRPPASTLRGRRLLLAAGGAFLAAGLVLALSTPWFGLSRLHIGGRFGDQAGYVTSARHLAETGELRSWLVYPAYVEHPEWRLYMPGAYVWLAASYALLGYGVVQTLLPSLVATMLAAAGAFVIGERYGGPRGGLLAALLLLVFPAFPLYAHTAMAEAGFVGAAVLALAVLVRLPGRARPLALPFLVALPFLFRETGALLVIPAAVLLVLETEGEDAGGWRRRAAVALGSVAATALVCYGLLRWQVGLGKGTFSVADWVLLGGFNYRNAVLPDLSAGLTLGDWLAALGGNAARNLAQLAAQAREEPLHLDTTGLVATVALAAGCLVAGLRAPRRRPLALGAGLLLLAVLLLLLFVYDSRGQKALRTVLFALPPGLIWLGCALARLSRRRPRLVLGLVLLLSGAGYATTAASARELVAADAVGDAGIRLIAELGHDEAKMLVVHPFLVKNTLAWAVARYPSPWAMMPVNAATYEKLRRRYDIGTFLVAEQTFEDTQPPELWQGLTLVRRIEVDGLPYYVYQAR